MISEIDTFSVVDETESAKVTTESQMAECSTELMRRPETTDGRWIPVGMQVRVSTQPRGSVRVRTTG